MSARDVGDQLLRRLLAHVVESVPGGIGAGVSLPEAAAGPVAGASSSVLTPPSPAPRARSVAAAGVAARLDPLQWRLGEGPVVEALERRRTVVVGRGAGDDAGVSGTGLTDARRWPALAKAEAQAEAELQPGSRPPLGVVVSAGEWAGDAPVLFSVYLDRAPDDAPGRATVDLVDRFEPLVANALALVEYCAGEEVRTEQVLHMVAYRRVIEQAKGLLMGALGVDAETAFATLARASQHVNVRLRNLAVALVEHVGHAPAEAPDDPAQVIVPTERDRQAAAQVWAALSGRGNVTML